MNPVPDAETSAQLPSAGEEGVSVIIPAFNYAQYLEGAVRSALGQTHQPVEVIIVDDGSTDGTPGLGARLAHEHAAVRYLRQRNAGLSAARNTGIAVAAHPFLTFLDSDDEFLPGMVATLMQAFRSRPASTGLVACATIRIDEHGTPIGQKRYRSRGSRPFTPADILMKTRFPCCVLVRRACFDSAGFFDTALRSSEDRDMWIRIGMRHGIYYVDEPLVRIRRHGGNMSRNTGRMRAAVRRVRDKAIAARVVPLIRIDFWLRFLAFDHFSGAWMFWDEGRPARALLHALIAMTVWPLPLDNRDLGEPPFFRPRAALRFLITGAFRRRGRVAAPSKSA